MCRVVFYVVLLLCLTACKDPYHQAPSKDMVQGKSDQYGSYQEALLNNDALTKSKQRSVWKVEQLQSPIFGHREASVTLVEFSDFECPFCSRGAKTLKEIVQKYDGKVRLLFKHFPLSFHKNAHLAAQASIEAQKQGKFWKFHDKLFENQKKLSRKDLEKYAKELSLDRKKFMLALDSNLHKAAVDQDIQQGQQVNISGTPTLFVNGRKVSIEKSKIESIIQEELLQTKSKRKKGMKGDSFYKELIQNGQINEKRKLRSKRVEKESEKKEVAVGNAPGIGDDEAPVTIVEFSDFECPYCSRSADAVKKIKTYFGKYVRIAFKHFPLNFHMHARLAAQASMAAHEQGRFWEYHDKLFSNQKKLGRGDLIRYALELGLDLKRFMKTLDARQTKMYVEDDIRQGSRLQVRGTPTLFVNDRLLSGGSEFSNLQSVVQAELRKKGITPPTLGPFAVKHSPQMGAKDAPVTIVEFSDFQCPFCAKASKTIHDVVKAYKGYVRVAFKNFPLNFHKNAHLAAQAALSAHSQGKFWAYHDLLFRNYRRLERRDLEQYAQQTGLDLHAFQKDLDSGTFRGQVDQDILQGSIARVKGTPAFFVNGTKVDGTGFAGFKKAIDPILLKKGIKKADLPDIPVKKIEAKQSPTKGPAKALVKIVEYSDFECPYCSRAAKVMKEIADAYKDKVQVIFKQYPLHFHKNAFLAAEASLAAHAQGKFWEYHDMLFANQKKLKKEQLIRYAKALSLDMPTFEKALQTKKYRMQVKKEMQHGEYVGVGGTPSFFINNRSVKAYTFEQFKAQIDPILLKNGVKKEDLPRLPAK